MPSGTGAWVVVRGTVGFGSFVFRIGKVLSFLLLFPSFFPQFLFLVLGLGLGLGLWLGLTFKPFLTDRSCARSQSYAAVFPAGTI